MSFIDIDKTILAKGELDSLLRRYKVIRVPTNAGWTVSAQGSGGISLQPFLLWVKTGTTASSRGMLYCAVMGLNSGTIHQQYIDWTKRIEIEFIISRTNSDSEVNARIQLKESGAEGILAERGIGVSIANYTMTGEAYGTTRGAKSLGTLTDSMPKKIKIVKTNNEVQFWVGDVLVGTLTGVAVPNVAGTVAAYLVVSITNGATGGVDAYFAVSNIIIVQEW